MAGEQVKRCFYCNKIVLPSEIQENGGCECGSRKLRTVFQVTDAEEAAMKAKGYVFDDEQWSDDRESAWVED